MVSRRFIPPDNGSTVLVEVLDEHWEQLLVQTNHNLIGGTEFGLRQQKRKLLQQRAAMESGPDVQMAQSDGDLPSPSKKAGATEGGGQSASAVQTEAIAIS